jgi:sulfane dehydrogenase subunit SoxC
MNSKEKSGKKEARKSSRRRFLTQGAVLAGLAAAGAVPRAHGQGLGSLFDGTQAPGYVPEQDLPKDHILKDPWTGEPLRDGEGNILVDWTGTPQYEKYLENARAMGGPAYGWRKKDWRLYGYRSPYVTTYRLGTAGTYTPAPSDVKTSFFSMLSPIEDQEGIITPASLHFHDDHGFEIPLVDPRKHRLVIGGMVERPVTLTMDDLRRLPSVSRIHTVECNSNGTPSHRNRLQPWATPGDIYGELSCSEWTGVLLSTLLDMVGVKKGASWIWAGASDEENHTKSIPLAKALDDSIVAYAQNGEPLRPEQGFPVRLVTPGWEGNTNIKRLATIRVTDELGPHLRESQIYTVMHSDGKLRWFQVEMQPKSCIVRPGPTHPITGKGYYEIRGFAWAGRGKIRRVEITTDGGRTWKDAQLQEPVLSKAMTRFVFPWQWNGEEVMLASRCTDEWGTTQPTTAETAKVWGVSPDWFKRPTGGVWRFNTIQPWKVDREGKVTNAIFSI